MLPPWGYLRPDFDNPPLEVQIVEDAFIIARAAETPELEDQGVRFIGVSIDGPRNQSKIKPFVQSIGMSYPVLRDIDSELMSELGVTAVPTLIVFDASGELLYLHEGFRPGDEHIVKHLSN